MQRPGFSVLTSLIALFLSLSAFATAQLLPELSTESEKEKFITQVHRQLPFATRNDLNLLNREIQIQSALQERFPNYNSWMAAKPGPFLIEAFERIPIQETRVHLAEDLFSEVRAEIQKKLAGDLSEIFEKQGPKGSSAEIKNELLLHGMRELYDVLQGSAESVRGVLIGLGQLIQGSERAQFFKLANPQLQIEFLKQQNFTDEQLRQSSFRPETVGLDRETATVEKVLEIAQRRIQRAQNIFNLLSYLKVISLSTVADFSLSKSALLKSTQLKSTQLKSITSAMADSLVRRLKSDEMDFVFKPNSEFLTEIAQMMMQAGVVESSKSGWLRQQLEVFQAGVPRSKLVNSILTKYENKKIATAVEVDPYLGIHRGCIGGDCSTSHSAFYPLSPWEHVFYIRDAEEKFVGYATLTRLRAGAVEAIYLKDLAGARMSPAVAEAVLYAFSKSTALYGAKKFFLAGGRFTNSNNSNEALRRMLSKYNASSSTGTLEFADSAIRDFIRNYRFSQNAGINGATYDSPETHREGVLFLADAKKAKTYSIKNQEGTIAIPSKEQVLTEFLSVLHRALIEGEEPKKIALKLLWFEEIEWGLGILKNSEGIPLAEYYKSLEDMFAAYNQELTPDFLRQHEDLFKLGHINASDAISVKNKSLRAKSEAYFIELASKGLQYADTFAFFGLWGERIKSSKAFLDLLKFSEERMNPQDVFNLAGFAGMGNKDARHILSKSENKPKVEAALVVLFTGNQKKLGIPDGDYLDVATRKQVGGLLDLVKNSSKYSVVNFESELNKHLRLFQLDLGAIESPELRLILDQALIKTSNAFSSRFSSRMFTRITQMLENDSITRTEFLQILHGLKPEHPDVKKMVALRLKKLQESKNLIQLIEMHLLSSMGFFDECKKYLKQDETQIRTNELLKLMMMRRYNLNLATAVSKEANELLASFQTLADPDFLYLTNFAEDIVTRDLGDAKERMQDFDSTIDAMHGISKNLMDSIEASLLLSLSWFKSKDVYTSPKSEVLDRTFKIILQLTKSGDAKAAHWDPLIANGAYLSQKVEFTKFVESLRSAFLLEKCYSCAEGLVRWITSGWLRPDFLSHREAVQLLLESPSQGLRKFGYIQASKNEASFPLSPEFLKSVTDEKENNFSSILAPVKALLQEQAIKAFSTSKYSASTVEKRRALLKIVKEDPINLKALQAARDFVSQGGNPLSAFQTLNSYYDRRRELESQASDEEADLYLPLKQAASRMCAYQFQKKR